MPQDQPLDRVGQGGIEPRGAGGGCWRWPYIDLGRVAVERHAAGQHLEEHHAQRVDIGARVGAAGR